jgi:hypothetical protein
MNTSPAINSRISRLPFLNSWLLDPARSTRTSSNRVWIDPGKFGGTSRETGKGRNGRVSENGGENTLPAKKLTAWISPGATRDIHRRHFLAMRG